MKPKTMMMICTDCGSSVIRRGPTQKYCSACSAAHDLERKKLWARENAHKSKPLPRETRRQKYLDRRAELGIVGIELSNDNKRSISWMAEEAADLLWVVRVSVPFDYAFSKNHIYSTTRNGHVFLRRESSSMRDTVTMAFRDALKGRKLAQNKVWLDVLVQKSNHKGDAVNVVDTICDALKSVSEVDDRWFSIRRLDWEIVKDNPRIYIGIGQESDIDLQACSICGQLLPYDSFAKNASNKKGIGRECKECKNTLRARVPKIV